MACSTPILHLQPPHAKNVLDLGNRITLPSRPTLFLCADDIQFHSILSSTPVLLPFSTIMSNPTGLTPTITPHAKRAIELYLHGIAVYAAYPERRTAEQMYEIRRVSENFTEADHVAYTSDGTQRQWWISAHNAFCDVMSEAPLPGFDGKPKSSSHAIGHLQGSGLQDQASHGQLDQTPKTPDENQGDVLTERKNVSSAVFNSSLQIQSSVCLD